MECGTREQKELLFTTGVQQDFPLGAWLVFSALMNSRVMARGSKPSKYGRVHTRIAHLRMREPPSLLLDHCLTLYRFYLV